MRDGRVMGCGVSYLPCAYMPFCPILIDIQTITHSLPWFHADDAAAAADACAPDDIRLDYAHL